jgi:hypothetical protein
MHPVGKTRRWSRVTIAAIATLLLGAMFAQNHVDAAEGSLVLPNPVVDSPVAPRSGKETAVIADGCFRGIQAVFQHVKASRVPLPVTPAVRRPRLNTKSSARDTPGTPNSYRLPSTRRTFPTDSFSKCFSLLPTTRRS